MHLKMKKQNVPGDNNISILRMKVGSFGAFSSNVVGVFLTFFASTQTVQAGVACMLFL